MKKITLFTTNNCPHCNEAKNYLDSKGLKYRLVNVKSPAGSKEFAKLRLRSVPILKIGDTQINGFSIKAFNNAYNQ
ncbi:MAG: glutaredoxin family protein [Gammaproteobacteria bacterium]|nr:glutaredoxin family protein [Gammaproteobacteria bacterium]